MINQRQENNQKGLMELETGSYLNAALVRGASYYEYQTYQVQVNQNFQDYEIIQKIGRGKYSDVYKCQCTRDDQFAVLKILKPVRPEKIKRQIKILKSLNHPNIINMKDVLFDKVSGCYCLVQIYLKRAFDFVKTTDYRYLYDQSDPEDIKTYIYQILKGLDHCHSKGIMHRDIKPQNLLFDHEKKHVKIADWGLADYYLPDKEYNVRVASRHYKGPELLLNCKRYHYSLDIWSLGLVFAGFIFQSLVLFRGESNPDQLNQIMNHFGQNLIEQYIKKYHLEPDAPTMKFIKNSKQKKLKSWDEFINAQNKHLCSPQALDLLTKMLVIDHVIDLQRQEERITVMEALKHPYFSELRMSKME